jgi:choline-glycine betaine transporter
VPCNVARLEALLFEAKSEWAEAERAYTQILEINPFDQVCHIVILMMILFFFLNAQESCASLN